MAFRIKIYFGGSADKTYYWIGLGMGGKDESRNALGWVDGEEDLRMG